MARLYNLSKAPRTVPFTLKLSTILGGFLPQIGWFFFVIGMIFLLAFGVAGGTFTNLKMRLDSWGPKESVTGVVVDLEETGTTVNDVDVVRYVFDYVVDGQELTGECFVNGWRYEVGSNVDVVYSPQAAYLAKIVDSSWSTMPPWILLFIGIFPGVGLLCIALGSKGHFKSLELLKRGVPAYGTLVTSLPTNMTINEQTVYEYTFKFQAGTSGREHLVKTKSHQGHAIEDEAEEPILYLPSDPDLAVLFDNLPSSASINSQGELNGVSPLSTLAKVALPTLGLLQTLLLLGYLVSVFF